MSKDDGYTLDMLNAARKLTRRFPGVTRAAFEQSDDLQCFAFWVITVVGEAAGKVSPEFRREHPEVPWREATAMRNVRIHQYAKIDLDRVWAAVTVSAPRLVRTLEPLVPPESKS